MNNSKNKSKLVNIIALVFGCVVGCILNITGRTDISHTVFAPIGSCYIRMLQFIALPMIFCLIIVSITSQPSIKKIASLAYGTILYNFLSATVLGIIAFCVTTLFVARNYLTLAPTVSACEHALYAQNYMDTLMNAVPSGILGKFMQNYLFFVLIVAIFFGILVTSERKRLDFFARIITSITSVLKKMLNIIVVFAPVGIFSIITNAFASNDLGALRNLLSLIVMVCVICVFYVLIITFFESIAMKKSFFSCLGATLPTILFGFATCSSIACIPLAQKSANDLGCRKEVSSFTIPTMNSLVKTGDIVYFYSLLTLAIVAGGNIMSVYKWFLMIFVAMACSLATPPISMAGMLVIPTALAHLGVPINQNVISLLFAIVTFIDMISVATTCASNIFCAVVLDKFISYRKKYMFHVKLVS